MARQAQILALLIATLACNRVAVPRPMAEVRDAVFKQQVAFWLDDHARESGVVICLGESQGGQTRGVEGSFLGHSEDRRAVRPAEHCETRASGAVERGTAKPAIIITIVGVTWSGTDEAVVEVQHFRSMVVSGRRKYRVVREQSGWVCLGQVVEMAPA